MLFFFMKPSCKFCPTFIFSLLVFIVACKASEGVVKNVSFPAAIIAFGDSIVDQGNNNQLNTFAKCNFLPYGKDFSGGTPTGRFSNGKTPPDLMAEILGIKELVPAYLDPNIQNKDLTTGVSFASGGTGYDPQTSQLVSVLSFSNQVEMFKEYIGKLNQITGEEGTKNILTNSIFLVVAGTNDLVNTYFTAGIRRLQYDVASYADLLVASASNFIQDIYKLGARRMAVFSAPPIGCLPAQRTLVGGILRECSNYHNQAAELYNTKLSSQMDSLNNSLPQARVVYIDIYNPLLQLIQNPQHNGFDVVGLGCCGTGSMEVSVLCNRFSYTCANDSKYLFWDSFHPTESGYRILVNILIEKYISSFL